MKFLTTILWPLRVWQIFGIVPFGLKREKLLPNRNSSLHYYAMASLAVHIAVFIHGMVAVNSYRITTERSTAFFNEVFTMCLMRFVACVIVAEAIFYRSSQIDTLELINQIDFNIEYKLRLAIDYKKNTFRNNLCAALWISIFLICDVSIFVTAHMKINSQAEKYWLFYSFPFLICTLQYQRLVYYVHLLRHRYDLLNDFLLNISSIQEKYQNDEGATETKTKRVFIEPLITTTQLRDFRNIYQQLYDASILVNDMFWWSLPLCILIDFHKMLVNSYSIFAYLLTPSPSDDAIVSIFWGVCNVAQLLLLSHACHSTSIKVI